jgi:hypothetical protein
MAITKMFRDRVVSMEQTLEFGEKYLELLSELVAEACPGAGILTHELESESDLFMIAVGGESVRTRRVKFTRMVLSDATCLAAIVADRSAPVRERLVGLLREHAEKDEFLVTFRAVMGDEDRAVGEEVDAEWRKKEEAAAAARRVEEQRRAEEKRRQKEIEAARHKARRDKGRGTPEGKAAAAPPQAQGAPGTGKKRRRRGRGGQPGQPGQTGQGQQPGQPQQARPATQHAPQTGPAQQGGPRPQGQRSRQPQPHAPRQEQAPRPQRQAPPPSESQGPHPPREAAPPGGAEAGGVARRRKRRRRRGGGGGPAPAGAGDGGGTD